MKEYPAAAAVLVRRHGVYVWGEFCLRLNATVGSLYKNLNGCAGTDWEKAKTQAEAGRTTVIFLIFLISFYTVFGLPIRAERQDETSGDRYRLETPTLKVASGREG